MEQEYNIGDLWEWARSGRLQPFTLYKNGEPACWIIRVNGDGMDWFYAQYSPDNGTFSVPFEPFGMWAWSEERMGCLRDEYAGLGNWSLREAEQRLESAYRGAAAAEVQKEADQLIAEGVALSQEDMDAAEQLAADLAERSIPADNWSESDLVVLNVPQSYPGALFLDEGAEIGRVVESIDSENPEIQRAARLIAALQKAERESAPSVESKAEEKPHLKAEPAPAEPKEEKAAGDAADAQEAVLSAIRGQKVKKLVVKARDDEGAHQYTVRRVGLVKDIEKDGSVHADNVLEGPKVNIPAEAIEQITTLSGKEVLYNK